MITVTVKEMLDQGWLQWDRFCLMLGLDRFGIAKGLMTGNETYVLTEEQGAELGLEHASSPPWQLVSEGLPPLSAWCWIWHATWTRDGGPRLAHYVVDGVRSHWWVEEGYLLPEQVTHWLPAHRPALPAEEP